VGYIEWLLRAWFAPVVNREDAENGRPESRPGSKPVEFPRARSNQRVDFVLSDPRPLEDVWTLLAQVSVTGIFLLLLGVVLFFSRALLLPVFAAAVISTTLGRFMKRCGRAGIPRWMAAFLIVFCVIGLAAAAVTLLAAPVSDWIRQAPQIGIQIKEKFSFLEGPLSAFHQLRASLGSGDANFVKMESGPADFLASAMVYLTPAASGIVIFSVTLVFLLIGQVQLCNFIVSLMPSREAKLRCLKIANDIEFNLERYLFMVTLINFVLGCIVGLGAWLIGLPHPEVLGLLAAIFNYVPYIGPAAMVAVLFSVGLVVFPSLSHALIAPLAFVGLATLEGQIVTPTVVGRRLTLNPLAIFLTIAFWAWLWGPLGAFLAIPLSIVGFVIINHLFPSEEAPQLPV
jgi:predicted PurR-regulated permease PerM